MLAILQKASFNSVECVILPEMLLGNHRPLCGVCIVSSAQPPLPGVHDCQHLQSPLVVLHVESCCAGMQDNLTAAMPILTIIGWILFIYICCLTALLRPDPFVYTTCLLAQDLAALLTPGLLLEC